MNTENARANMIEQQIRPWDVLDQRSLNTLSQIPREFFLPAALKPLAFADTRLPLGHGRKTLNPNIEGRILQALNLHPNERVLEIGTGSGYLTACLASLCQQVDSVEFAAPLVKAAQDRLDAYGVTNIHLEHGDMASWGSHESRYDAIVLNGSLPEIPASLPNMLNVGGRLFGFIGRMDHPVHRAILATRIGPDQWSEPTLFETWVDPLDISDNLDGESIE
ncbi:MAG TPA: protein-L-isoaspartate O-methyltransferase [Gammaproteobacteria bacterium]|nr:protein-L-isoaspartate O-methyltransferase [Gammaproteobacteria bacterium]